MATRKARYENLGGLHALTSVSNQTAINMKDGPNYSIVMSEDTELQTPSNMVIGQKFTIAVLSDATSELTFNADWIPIGPLSDIWIVGFGSAIIECFVSTLGGTKVFYDIKHSREDVSVMEVSPAVTGTLNDYSPVGTAGAPAFRSYTTSVRLDLSGYTTLRGVDASNHSDGQRVAFTNKSTSSMQVDHLASGQTAGNQIYLPDQRPAMFFDEGDTFILEYDSDSAYWRLILAFRDRPPDYSQPLSSSSNSVAINANTGPIYDLLNLAENTTLANPTNMTEGMTIDIVMTQDATGGRTVAFDTSWVNVGPIETVALAANAETRIKATVRNDGGLKVYYEITHAEAVDGLISFSETLQTTDATVTAIYTHTPANNTISVVEYTIVGKDTDTGTTDYARYHRKVTYSKDNAGVGVRETDNVVSADDESAGAAAWDRSSANASGTLEIRVQGEAAHTIDWRIDGVIQVV